MFLRGVQLKQSFYVGLFQGYGSRPDGLGHPAQYSKARCQLEIQLIDCDTYKGPTHFLHEFIHSKQIMIIYHHWIVNKSDSRMCGGGRHKCGRQQLNSPDACLDACLRTKKLLRCCGLPRHPETVLSLSL